MDDDICLYVVGGTSKFYEKEQGYAVGTEGVKEYLESLDRTFETHFFSEEGDSSFSSTDPLSIDLDNLHTQSVSSFSLFVIDYFRNTLRIMTNKTSKCEISVLYLPSMFSFLISIPLLLKSDRIILYYMSDTEKVVRNNDSILTSIKDTIYDILDQILLRKSDSVLYRDESVVARSDQSHATFRRSKPLVAMEGENLYHREDTCEDEPIQLLYVGSLIPRKGINDLLEAVSELTHSSSRSFRLIVVGDGPEKAELVERSKELEIDHFVQFKGHIPDHERLINIYRESDIFILPSIEEGFPRVVVEAMSQSLPVITTEVGEIPERINKNEAVLIPPRSPEDITAAIELVVCDKQQRKELISNGNRKAENILSSSAAKQHISIIRSLYKSGTV